MDDQNQAATPSEYFLSIFKIVTFNMKHPVYNFILSP